MKHCNLKFGLLFLLLSKGLNGQSNSPDYLGSGGDYYSQNSYSLSFTLGEFATTTHSNTQHLTQGFQQPHFLIMGLDEESDKWALRPYPNPTTQEIWIEMSHELQSLSWFFRLHDANGKLLLSLPYQNAQSISLAQFSSGNYYLSLLSGQRHKTFKIVKCD